jgi:hypothetical protein
LITDNPTSPFATYFNNQTAGNLNALTSATVAEIDALTAAGTPPSNHLLNGQTQAVDIQVPGASGQTVVDTALELDPYITAVRCKQGAFEDCSSADNTLGNNALHLDLRNNNAPDSGPPLSAAVTLPSGICSHTRMIR